MWRSWFLRWKPNYALWESCAILCCLGSKWRIGPFAQIQILQIDAIWLLKSKHSFQSKMMARTSPASKVIELCHTSIAFADRIVGYRFQTPKTGVSRAETLSISKLVAQEGDGDRRCQQNGIRNWLLRPHRINFAHSISICRSRSLHILHMSIFMFWFLLSIY
jgi:hypothetical protein